MGILAVAPFTELRKIPQYRLLMERHSPPALLQPAAAKKHERETFVIWRAFPRACQTAPRYMIRRWRCSPWCWRCWRRPCPALNRCAWCRRRSRRARWWPRPAAPSAGPGTPGTGCSTCPPLAGYRWSTCVRVVSERGLRDVTMHGNRD